MTSCCVCVQHPRHGRVAPDTYLHNTRRRVRFTASGQGVEAQFRRAAAAHGSRPRVLRSDRQRPSVRGRTGRGRVPRVGIAGADGPENAALLERRRRAADETREAGHSGRPREQSEGHNQTSGR